MINKGFVLFDLNTVSRYKYFYKYISFVFTLFYKILHKLFHNY